MPCERRQKHLRLPAALHFMHSQPCVVFRSRAPGRRSCPAHRFAREWEGVVFCTPGRIGARRNSNKPTAADQCTTSHVYRATNSISLLPTEGALKDCDEAIVKTLEGTSLVPPQIFSSSSSSSSLVNVAGAANQEDSQQTRRHQSVS
jgi:hypothetical protein